MDFQFSIVLDKTQFAEFVHEKTHARLGRADHLRQGFLTDLSHDRLRPAFRAEVCKEKEKSGGKAPALRRYDNQFIKSRLSSYTGDVRQIFCHHRL